MASSLYPRANRTVRQRKRRRRTLVTIRRFARARWREFKRMRAALAASPPAFQIVIGAILILLLWSSVNWSYHAINKPTEVFFPLDDSLDKSPAETWRQYGALFREHSTAVITPDLLAALAQVEGAGNPVARTYWRWQRSWNPFALYRPASSAVGMYQITDGTFQEAKRYCIHNHKVVEEGPWHDMKSCWFNSLYTRVVPSHAIELTAVLLDRGIASAIGRRRIAAVTLRKKQDLAAVIHLCGAGAGHAYATSGFKLSLQQRCGDHDVGRYLSQVNTMRRQFVRLAATD
jgi:hypothetical protein